MEGKNGKGQGRSSGVPGVDIDVDVLLTLLTSCQSGLDLGRTSSSKAEDKNQILMEVRHSAGQKRMQQLTSESIVRAARGWLRWSGEPQDMAQYVALMLRSKEYAQLQYVLNAVDEIHDDEATLKEVGLHVLVYMGMRPH
ncbi:hypothetical protein DUNSADRAFT_7034 [Dunaliella salina]|uniref:Uncharacterized protein n=1 Tax=Dunaliella salina TaxID=3046 RepID=A0ABQ7GM33_DUNSA|nr:hypothetical protein DUNSADRAFT_7034 [Dunaliella salina]|eukprot:KAF5835674.1 hypothetical protein DUNSADRAFT_7034 [Dunaliella salina]